MPFAHITGWGMYVPEPVLTNDDIAKLVETSDEWIRERTGIRERHIARETEFPSTLGVEAAIRALKVANLAPTELDLIICTSSSPEYIFPATACIIQDQIGATKAGAFDLQAACTGFVYALNMGAQAIRSGSMKNVLVIGTEVLSRFVNWKDRNTCILFGDGAGAFVLQASDQPGGVMSAVMHSDGSGADSLSVPAGGAHSPATEATIREGKHFIQMDGKEVFRFATRVMGRAVTESLEQIQLTTNDVQWIVPHQANYRIIESAAKHLKMPLDKFVINVDRYGNTSTASIPLATIEALQKSQIKPNDKVVFVAFGGGLTWGAMVVEWTGPLPAKKQVHLRQYRLFARLRSFIRRIFRHIEGFLSRKEV
ncbi:MAG: ketoacyl-ACP synthase III [Chloroflexi bacterium]|nr:ketoacyl-ACP synthase III [Chloroflexota bacterium]